MNPLNDSRPLGVLANVRMLGAEEGGRTTAAKHPYRPNHNFGNPSNRDFYIGQFELGASECISPGESRLLGIRFIGSPGLLGLLTPGREWRLQEGTQLVGTATLVQLVGEP